MNFAETRDRARIERFLRLDIGAHVYALADLDDFFWPSTRWFAAERDGEYQAVVLLLEKLSKPIVYAVSAANHPATRALLEWLRAELPASFFYNLGPGLETSFTSDRDHEPEGRFWKMQLTNPALAGRVDTSRVEMLPAGAIDELRAFYEGGAYAADENDERFLEPYMVENWPYACVRDDGRIVAAGGTHVLSEHYRVAAIGNLATRPEYRSRGFGRAISARLCAVLHEHADHIGLNVHADNRAAIACYLGLGFERVIPYLEGTLTSRHR